jgi:outer membrane protein
MSRRLATAVRFAVLALAAAGLSQAAQAQSAGSPWMVRARIVNIDPANQSDAIPSLGVPADAIHVSGKTIPEVDISYFFTPNIAAELILTYPQKHTVTLSGTNIGSFKHLPPTLTLQYHFAPGAAFQPYVGAGVNATFISGVSLNVPGVGALDLSKTSFGPAVQAGFDYRIDKNWYLNLDVKKVYISADVKAGGAKVSKVNVDPLLLGIGIGYKF